MVLNPVNSGTLTLHCDVPAAVPDWPKLFDHVTDATATLSEAVPLNATEEADVEIEVEAGDTIVKLGGVVSPDVGVVGAGF